MQGEPDWFVQLKAVVDVRVVAEIRVAANERYVSIFSGLRIGCKMAYIFFRTRKNVYNSILMHT